MQDIFGRKTITLIIFFEVIIILSNLLLIFIEWNMEENVSEPKFFLSAMFIDVLALFLYYVLSNITIDNYVAYNILLSLNIYLFSLSNYMFLFGIKVISIVFKFNSERKKLKRKVEDDSKLKTKDKIIVSDLNPNSLSRSSNNNLGSKSSMSNISNKLFEFQCRKFVSSSGNICS